ncbi:MAG: AbrB/MazE/SpoVT family DNA-binding domain-containing protein [Candidatus Paceibacterota bacterium]
MAQKVIKIGKSSGITLPKSVLEKLGVSVGDQVDLSVTDRSATITPSKGSDDRQRKIAELTLGFIDRYRDDLNELAK